MILSTRVPAFARLLSGEKFAHFSIAKRGSTQCILVNACHPIVVLLLLQYVYADDIAAVWDSRVTRAIQARFSDLKLDFSQIKADLKALAITLDIAPLLLVLDSAAKMPMTRKTLSYDMRSFFSKTCLTAAQLPGCDVSVLLADRQIACSSVILRARCPFFEAMFADSDWTAARLGEGRVTIHMEHLKWRPMNMVFRFIHEGLADDLFDYHRKNMLRTRDRSDI